jgi:hypothetical protein
VNRSISGLELSTLGPPDASPTEIEFFLSGAGPPCGNPAPGGPRLTAWFPASVALTHDVIPNVRRGT